jgi:hypothetical protein
MTVGGLGAAACGWLSVMLLMVAHSVPRLAANYGIDAPAIAK